MRCVARSSCSAPSAKFTEREFVQRGKTGRRATRPRCARTARTSKFRSMAPLLAAPGSATGSAAFVFSRAGIGPLSEVLCVVSSALLLLGPALCLLAAAVVCARRTPAIAHRVVIYCFQVLATVAMAVLTGVSRRRNERENSGISDAAACCASVRVCVCVCVCVRRVRLFFLLFYGDRTG